MSDTLFIFTILGGLAVVAIVKILFWGIVGSILYDVVVGTVAEVVKRANEDDQ